MEERIEALEKAVAELASAVKIAFEEAQEDINDLQERIVCLEGNQYEGAEHD